MIEAISMNKPSSENVVWHHATISRQMKEKSHGHRSVILWFTGLSGSGKSTIAHAVEDRLYRMGCSTYVLDGDNVRHGLCGDLGFSDVDRKENIRRISEMAKLFIEAGVITLTAFISPFRSDRRLARSLVERDDFIEIFCNCPLEVCERRDPKGLYKKARAGLIKGYTGISSPYEPPSSPELEVNTDELSIDQCVDKVIGLLLERAVIDSGNTTRTTSTG